MEEVLGLVQYRTKPLSLNAGWTVGSTGSGSVGYAPDALYVSTGTTASSDVYADANIYGFNPEGQAMNYLDWDKDMILEAYIARQNSDPQVTAELYLGGIITMLFKLIGFTIDNMTLKGHARNTDEATVDLGVTLQPNIGRWVAVKHIPGQEVGFYVDGVKKGSITGSTYVPSGYTTSSYCRARIANGPTGGVDARLYVSSLRLFKRK